MTHRELEELLRHEPFVRALARYLLGDREHAEDIVQETWLAALQARRRPDDHRSWLAGIVRNLVRRALRGRARRARREQSVARSLHVRAADELYTEATVRRRVAELVLALPGIYREAILLRFFDGLAPRVIAERLGLRGSTVRMRLKRGLAMVRQQLIADFGGDERSLGCTLGGLAVGATSRARAAWSAAGVGAATLVAAVALLGRPSGSRDRAMPPSTAAHGPAATARASLAEPERGPGASGAFVREAVERPLRVESGRAAVRGLVHLPAGVSTRTVRVAVFDGDAEIKRVAVDGGEPFTLALDRQASRVVATHPETEPGATELRGRGFEITLERRALTDVRRFAAPAPPDAAEDEAPATSAARPAPWVRDDSFPAAPAALVGIVHVPDGVAGPVTVSVSRADGGRVRATVPPETWFVLSVARLVADPVPASLRVDVFHPDALPLRVDAPVYVDPETQAARLGFLVLELEASRVLRGRVRLEDAGFAAGVTVVAFRAGESVVANAATTGPDGTFTLDVGIEGEWSVAAAADGYRPAVTAAPETGDVAPLVLRRGAAVDGYVRVAAVPAAGEVVRAALVDAGQPAVVLDEGVELVRVGGDLAWRAIAVRTDAKGEFRIGGLARAEYEVKVEGLAAPAQRVRAPGTAEFALAPAHVVVAVTFAGAPLPGALVATADAGLSTNDQGEATLAVPPGANLRVTVSAPGLDGVERAVTAPAAGGTMRLDVDLGAPSDLATLELQLDSVDGPPLPARCDFVLLRLDAGGNALRRSASATSGRYVLRDLEPGAYLGIALPGGYFLAALIDATLARGATVRVRLGVRAGGRVHVRLEPPGGGGAPPADVWFDGPAVWDEDPFAAIFGDAGEWFLAPAGWRVADGGFESELLPAGRYTVHVEPLDAGFAPTHRSVDVRAGATTKLIVPLAAR